MLGHTECSNSAEAEAETYSSTITSSSTTTTTTISVARNKKKSKNRRRFSDEQIKSLESMFETEWRLEPRKKAEAAHELGLQPRQLAIWFQNKRARWKAKQLQRDFNALRADYSALASRFEALKEEKQALLIQVPPISIIHLLLNLSQSNLVDQRLGILEIRQISGIKLKNCNISRIKSVIF